MAQKCGQVPAAWLGTLERFSAGSANMEIFAALLLVTSTFIKAGTRLGDCHGLGKSRLGQVPMLGK